MISFIRERVSTHLITVAFICFMTLSLITAPVGFVIGQSNPTPDLVNVQVPNGNPDVIEVTYDTTLEVVGTNGDLNDSYSLSAQTINNVSIDDARIGVPATSVVLDLSGAILPQDGSINTLSYDPTRSRDTLRAENGTAEPASFSNETITNNLNGPVVQEAAIPSKRPQSLVVTFENPVEVVGSTGDIQNAFQLNARTQNNATIDTNGSVVFQNQSTIELNLSAPVVPQDGGQIGNVSFTQTDANDTLRGEARDVAVEDSDVVVENELDGPAIQAATIPPTGPQTLIVTFDEPVEIVGSAGDIQTAFKLSSTTRNNVTIDTNGSVVFQNQSTIELNLSAPVVPQDGTQIGDLSFVQGNASDTLRGTTGKVVAENSNATVENNLDGPTAQQARVPSGSPERLLVRFDQPIEIIGTSEDIQTAFELSASTQNSVTIDTTTDASTINNTTIELGLSAPLTPGDGTLNDALSFRQADASETLRNPSTRVLAENFSRETVVNRLSADRDGANGRDRDDDDGNVPLDIFDDDDDSQVTATNETQTPQRATTPTDPDNQSGAGGVLGIAQQAESPTPPRTQTPPATETPAVAPQERQIGLYPIRFVLPWFVWTPLLALIGTDLFYRMQRIAYRIDTATDGTLVHAMRGAVPWVLYFPYALIIMTDRGRRLAATVQTIKSQLDRRSTQADSPVDTSPLVQFSNATGERIQYLSLYLTGHFLVVALPAAILPAVALVYTGTTGPIRVALPLASEITVMTLLGYVRPPRYILE
jgi:hypothetical protein